MPSFPNGKEKFIYSFLKQKDFFMKTTKLIIVKQKTRENTRTKKEEDNEYYHKARC
jgi:hypothetical protein